jgi:hypothetical protein
LPTRVETYSHNVQPHDKGYSAHDKGYSAHDKGYSAVAKELGIDPKAVRQADKIEKQVTDEAKEAARKADLIDNNSAMLKVVGRIDST